MLNAAGRRITRAIASSCPMVVVHGEGENDMGPILAALQVASLGAAHYGVDIPMVAPRGAPSFADEFNDKTIDTTQWRFDTSRNAVGWFNNERQYYAKDRARNARVERGTLIIEARREAAIRMRFRDGGGQG
jgi:hypothetical protein